MQRNFRQSRSGDKADPVIIFRNKLSYGGRMKDRLKVGNGVFLHHSASVPLGAVCASFNDKNEVESVATYTNARQVMQAIALENGSVKLAPVFPNVIMLSNK
eukprot:GHVN01014103.1.p2 GENE.GHVN01014103.1~~GHVN01014103.1.p2  ORF type:complete len:102 (+),score=6.31 GHVN01014103.1:632-937(+)